MKGNKIIPTHVIDRASPSKRGRPNNEIGFMHIKLKKGVHKMWTATKETLGFSTKTNSDFARHLLLNLCEGEPSQTPVMSPGDEKYYILVC